MNTMGLQSVAPKDGIANNHDTARPAAGAADAQHGEPRWVGPSPRSTPAGLGSRRLRSRPLPADLLQQASHRLQIIALLAAGLWLLSTVLYHLVDRVIGAGDASWMSLQPSDAIVGAGVAISVALFFYLRYGSPSPRFTLDLGLAYMIAIAFIVGVLTHWAPVPHASTMPTLSWIGVSVLLFAATLPNAPAKTAAAGLVAASMSPVGMLIARSRGAWPFESAWTAWTMHYPDFLIVGASLIISRVVTGLGQHVARAREMGSYQLGELIGRGGMGEVYKATHRMLARPAAIKLIRPETLAARNGEEADIAVKRFHREAAAVAQLRSPHTVDLYDFGATADGALYFAMELLEGMDLDSLVRQTGPLPAARVVHILSQVCDSLEEAHAYGLVHRDIKPANIHIGRVGRRDDFVKVLDFGLVTSRGTAGGLPQLATVTGTVPGTPAYMAPEMALGDRVDGRADIYALGCVAYYLLTGHLVFGADNAMQSLVKSLREEPVRPSARTELPIPADLEALVLACLGKDPATRPATAGDLARSLARVKVAAWTDEEAKQWWAVHRPEYSSDRNPQLSPTGGGR
jgi:eukaryotic-like serine/threonine-protein kinase